VVAPGERISLTFPTEISRGVAWYLMEWTGQKWTEPSYLLISDGGGAYNCSECPTYYGHGVPWGWPDAVSAGRDRTSSSLLPAPTVAGTDLHREHRR
jgi:hypothetical protein